MKKPDHRSSCNRLQSGPVLVFFPVARPDLETLEVEAEGGSQQNEVPPIAFTKGPYIAES